jgi:hypothetical protein
MNWPSVELHQRHRPADDEKCCPSELEAAMPEVPPKLRWAGSLNDPGTGIQREGAICANSG